MNLKQLFDKYGCDKSSKHHYHTVYEKIMSPKKNDDINFLEIGVWKGASTRAFADYFTNGSIYGIDIFTRLEMKDVEIGDRNISLMKGDSMSPDIGYELKSTFGKVEFDFILDDGAHYPEANKLSFRHLSPFLKKGGLYIIEDVWPLDIMTIDQLNHPWLKKYPDRYNVFENNMFKAELTSSGFNMKAYNLRSKSHEPDSYIITLEKV